MAHIQGKTSKRTRLTGGGLITAHVGSPSSARPSSSTLDRSLSPGAAVSRPLFRPPEADSDDPDADDEAFEPVAPTSSSWTGDAPPPSRSNGEDGVTSSAQGRSRVSHLPPPPKKRQKAAAPAEQAEGEQLDEGGAAAASGGKGRGRGGRARGARGGAAGRARGKGRNKTDRETMERLLDPAVDFPDHFVRLEKTFKVRCSSLSSSVSAERR